MPGKSYKKINDNIILNVTQDDFTSTSSSSDTDEELIEFNYTNKSYVNSEIIPYLHNIFIKNVNDLLLSRYPNDIFKLYSRIKNILKNNEIKEINQYIHNICLSTEYIMNDELTFLNYISSDKIMNIFEINLLFKYKHYCIDKTINKNTSLDNVACKYKLLYYIGKYIFSIILPQILQIIYDDDEVYIVIDSFIDSCDIDNLIFELSNDNQELNDDQGLDDDQELNDNVLNGDQE